MPATKSDSELLHHIRKMDKHKMIVLLDRFPEYMAHDCYINIKQAIMKRRQQIAKGE